MQSNLILQTDEDSRRLKLYKIENAENNLNQIIFQLINLWMNQMWDNVTDWRIALPILNSTFFEDYVNENNHCSNRMTKH